LTVRVLGARPPVCGGRDVDVPGAGIRLRATRWMGHGSPVLLLHGLASQRRFWDLVVPHLVGLPLVALDQRGHGDSEQPDDGYDTSTVVRDALTALDSLALSRVVVVGHSWGGMTALTMAADHPERVLGVVAIDGGAATPRDTGQSAEEVRRRMAPPRIELPPDQVPAMLRQHAAQWWTAAAEAAVLPLFAIDGDGLARPRLRFDNHMRIIDAMLDYDAADVLARVRVPPWLVIPDELGTPDGGTPAGWLAAKQAILGRLPELAPHARVVRVAGAAHDVPLQWPALVAGVIRAATDDTARNARQEEAR
jgi:pimeloyl-ACP methyl ester carboxylesterase